MISKKFSSKFNMFIIKLRAVKVISPDFGSPFEELQKEKIQGCDTFDIGRSLSKGMLVHQGNHT